MTQSEIENFNIPYYTSSKRKKGISDRYVTPELEIKIELMKGIEKLIPNNWCPFGWKHSEALVTLTRTPNNTFPIFWNTHKKGGKNFKAPFERK